MRRWRGEPTGRCRYRPNPKQFADEPRRSSHRGSRPRRFPRSGREPCLHVGAVHGRGRVPTAWLVARGAAFPPLGPFLLLGIVVALCVNRFVFFPNEVGVTAEAAALFTAAVAFRGSSPVLAPVALALLVGVLDAAHWERRAFIRMAYNSGSQAITMLVSLALFVPLVDAWGSAWFAIAGAAVVAAIPYVLVESVLGVVLVVFHGEGAKGAVCHQVPLNALAIPLALYGVVAACLAASVGWWLAFPVLMPVPLAPELVLVRVPRRWRRPRTRIAAGDALGLVLLAGTLTVLGLGLLLPDPVTLAALVVMAVLMGAECRVDGRRQVPVLGSVVVVAAVVVAHGDSAYLAAVVAAVVATSVAWTMAGTQASWRVAPIAASGACVAAVGFGFVGTDDRVSVAVLGGGLLAGVAFLVVTGTRPPVTLWCLPVIGAAATLATLWNLLGRAGAAPFALGMGSIMVAALLWGAAPWRSRMLGSWAASRGATWRRIGFLAASTGALACACVGAVAHGEQRETWLLLASTCAQADVAMAMLGVRQWRFAPRASADAAGLAAAAVLVTLAPALASGASPWAWPALAVPVALAARTTTGLGRVRAEWRSADDQLSE